MSKMLRQEDYTIRNTKAKNSRRRTQLAFSIEGNLPVETQILTRKRAKNAGPDVQQIVRRTRHIQQLRFNLNSYSEEESLHAFRYKKGDVGRVSKSMGWNTGRRNVTDMYVIY